MKKNIYREQMVMKQDICNIFTLYRQLDYYFTDYVNNIDKGLVKWTVSLRSSRMKHQSITQWLQKQEESRRRL